MAKSKATFSKRDKEKKKLEKRQEKAEKREERKANSQKGASLEDMMVYVDDDGNFSSTPPDPTKKKKEISHHEIELDITKRQAAAEEDARRNGVVTMFNHEKGYGFIRDLDSQKSVFVHINSVHGEIKEGDKISFDLQRTLKGDSAANVQKKS